MNNQSGQQPAYDVGGSKTGVSWMRSLASRYQEACRDHPDDPLLLVCDIDGTIIDMRHVVLSVLQSYDRAHGTAHFPRLVPADITVHENQVGHLLDELPIPRAERSKIVEWYLEHRWLDDTVLNMHRAFNGAFPMIRWFQIQPRTEVALVTGRPEALREATLRSLNKLGETHRVHFCDELLLMNPGGWEQGVPQAKVRAIDELRARGHHVFAMIDNEPAILEALSAEPQNADLLLLHADTIFESQAPDPIPSMVSGGDYQLAELIPGEADLPEEVQLVWHGVNDRVNLGHFVDSQVKWAEVDIRPDPADQLILRHDSLERTPFDTLDDSLDLEEALVEIKAHNRGVKLDFKVGGEVLDRVLEIVERFEFEDDCLWFNANIEALGEQGFRTIAEQHPAAIIQCPVDWLAPLLRSSSDEARRILDLLTEWGITRLSISWERKDLRGLLSQLRRLGHQVNIYNVADLESFLEAVVLLPESVTSDFNFPKWNRFGHGSGKAGLRVAYPLDTDGVR